MSIQTTYEELRKIHSVLPEYDSVNKEFEISTIQPPEFLLRNIKRKIAETMEPYLDLLERLTSPRPDSFTDMYETSAFTNEEKAQLVQLYRHFMEQYRGILETDLIGDDKTDATFIRTVHDKWIADKKQFLPLIITLREFWHQHVEEKEMLDYLGWTSYLSAHKDQVKEHKHNGSYKNMDSHIFLQGTLSDKV